MRARSRRRQDTAIICPLSSRRATLSEKPQTLKSRSALSYCANQEPIESLTQTQVRVSHGDQCSRGKQSMNESRRGVLILIGVIAVMACTFIISSYYVKSASKRAPALGPLPETTSQSLDELFNAEAELRVRQLNDLKEIEMRYFADPKDESLVKSYCYDMAGEGALMMRKLALTGYVPPDDRRKAIAERVMNAPRGEQEKDAAQKSGLASEFEEEAKAELAKFRARGFRASLACK